MNFKPFFKIKITELRIQQIKDLKISYKLLLPIGSVVFVILFILGLVVYFHEASLIRAKLDEQMSEQLIDINEIIDLQIANSQKTVNCNLSFAEYMLDQSGYIKESSSNSFTVNAINQVTKEFYPTKVEEWTIDGKTIHDNFEFVDFISLMSGASATVFQKIENGYLRISTNVKNDDGTRALNTFIPNESPVVKAIENDDTYLGRAFVVNDWFLAAYKPIKIRGVIKGMLFVGVKEKDSGGLKTFFYSKRFLNSGFPFMVNYEGKTEIYPKMEGVDISKTQLFAKMKAAPEGGITIFSQKWPEDETGEERIFYLKKNKNIASSIVITISEHELTDQLAKIKWFTIIATILSLILIGFTVIFVARWISATIKKVLNFANQIAEGDLTAKIDIDQKDELGLMSASLNKMVDKLEEIIDEVNSSSEQVTAASKQTSSGAQDLAKGANHQAANVEEISSAMEEMVSSISQNNDNAKTTEQLAIETSKKLDKIKNDSQVSLEKIEAIAKKIKVIDEIAQKTNILALNAAVEASHVGELGKGFAVVAGEVKKLAESSKIAAKEINFLSADSVKAIERTVTDVINIIPDIKKTNDLVMEISAASEEQHLGVNQINTAIMELNSITQQNAASSEEIASNAEELSAQAEALLNAVQYFTVEK